MKSSKHTLSLLATAAAVAFGGAAIAQSTSYGADQVRSQASADMQAQTSPNGSATSSDVAANSGSADTQTLGNAGSSASSDTQTLGAGSGDTSSLAGETNASNDLLQPRADRN